MFIVYLMIKSNKIEKIIFCVITPLRHDGQQFHQYQQNKQPHLTSISLTTIKIKTYNVGNPGTGLGQSQTLFVDISGIVDHHCLPFLFIISTITVI